MPWFPVDDTFHSHPKRLATSPAALGLWVVAGSWSNAHLTDGHIPEHALTMLLPDATELADELVRTGLWKRDRRGGYVFHDWMKWGSKRSAKDVRKLRADRAAAGRKGGLASGKTRSKPASKPEAIASATVEPPALPSPSSTYTGSNQRGRHARTHEDKPSFNGRPPNPGDSPAARSPSARPLAAALEAAGINGTPPLRGQPVADFAAQARRALEAHQDTEEASSG